MLQFLYVPESLRGPAPPSLGQGATVRWRPLIPVRLIGPAGQSRQFNKVLLDTGSDDTIFPMAAARMLGVQFVQPTGHVVRWHGQRYGLRYGEVDLELTEGGSTWRWSAIIGFSDAPIRYPLLGNSGCLEFFDAKFFGDDHLVQLETSAAYPGTK